MAIRQLIYLVFIAVLLSCCNNESEGESKNTKSDTSAFISNQDTLVKTEVKQTNSSTIVPGEKLVVGDKSKYSKKFLEGLLETPSGYEFRIKDSVLTIVGQGDAVFPNIIPLNEKRKFVGKRGNETFEVLIGRINYSTIGFEIKIIKNGKQISFDNGTADIGSMFFLASEIDEDERTGISYSSYEYYAELDGCDFSLRIGVGDDDGKLRAKIKRNCIDKSKNIDLENCPTLYVK